MAICLPGSRAFSRLLAGMVVLENTRASICIPVSGGFRFARLQCVGVVSLVLLLVGIVTLNAQLVISEVMVQNRDFERDNYGNSSDWLELHNTSDAPVNLEDWTLSDDADELRKWWLPDVRLAPGRSLRIWASGRDESSRQDSLHANFKLSREGESLFLTRPYERAATDEFDCRDMVHFSDVSVGLPAAYFGKDVLGFGAPGRFWIGASRDMSERWIEPGFDDGDWSQGRAPFGFDRQAEPTHADEIQTDLGLLVDVEDTRACFRFQFDYSGTESGFVTQLSLRFREGVVAYLNGERIARRGILKGQSWDARAERFVVGEGAGDVQYLTVEDIDSRLLPGRNVLAIEVTSGEGRAIDLHLSPLIRSLPKNQHELKHPVYLTSPSPNRLNGNGFQQVARAPRFSVRGGSYSQSVVVTLEPEQRERGTIHYTTDGTVPSLASPVFRRPLTLTQSTIVRGRTFDSTSMPSPTVTERFSIVERPVRQFSSNLPIVLIDTQGASIDPDAYHPMLMEVHEPGADGRTRWSKNPSFRGVGSVKHRGSSSLRRPKKNYRLELQDRAGDDLPSTLLGMPTASDWILYGPYDQNQTLINNALVYEMSRRMGRYAPRTRFVEVFVNEEMAPLSMRSYVGLYLLMERIERREARVDLKKPGLGGASLSGGYLFKIDRTGPDETGFRAGWQDLVFVDPSERRIHPRQVDWMRGYIDRFFSALTGPSFDDPETGYAAFIDVDSFIDQRLIQEITWNPDAYSLSTYFTKPRNGKLRAGPAWDFDRALYVESDIAEREYFIGSMDWCDGPGYNWGALLWDDPEFVARFRARGRSLLETVWENEAVNRHIDELAEEIAEAQERNYRRWGFLSPREWREWVEHLKMSLAVRSNWLAGKFLDPPKMVSTPADDRRSCRVAIESKAGHNIYYLIGSRELVDTKGRLDRQARRYEGAFAVESNQTVFAVVEKQGRWSDPTECHCLVPSLPLVVTEIQYKPSEGSEFEFLEFMNVGEETIDLRGVIIQQPVDFAFAEGRVAKLAPGELVLVMSNEQEYGRVLPSADLRIAGSYEDRLSNDTGQILVTGPAGETVAEVFYTDAWFPETDDLGHSLELSDPRAALGRSRLVPQQWRASTKPGGTPGSAPNR